MKCHQCGHQMKTARENYLYKESGLPNVTLMGIEVSRCRSCGEHEAVIPRIEQLGSATMGSAAERLLRLSTLTREPAGNYSLGLLKDMARTEPVAQRLRVRVEKGRWKTEAA